MILAAFALCAGFVYHLPPEYFVIGFLCLLLEMVV